MLRVGRAIVVLLAAATSAFVIVLLFADAMSIAERSDSQLLEAFRRSTPDDVFRYGFWGSWTPLAMLQAAAVAAAWMAGKGWPLRSGTAVVLLAFSSVSVFGYIADQRLEQLWNTAHRSPSTAK